MNYVSRHGFEQGLQIVCFYKKSMEEAKKEYPRSYFRPDIKDKEAIKTHFYIGDRVITSCGFIDYISNITYNGEPKQKIHQETYTGCGITLPGLPGRLFHATELKFCVHFESFSDFISSSECNVIRFIPRLRS